MAFSVNPLSLSIPQGAFESWLRDSGYLEVIDGCPVDNSLAGSSRATKLSSLLTINPFGKLTTEDLCKDAVPWTGEFFDCGLGPRETYSWPTSIIQMKLRMEENLKRYTWNYIYLSLVILACFLLLDTLEIGHLEQVLLENDISTFPRFWYKMPVAFLGLVSLVAFWDILRVYSNKWGLQTYPFIHQILILIANFVTVIIMIYCKVALALCWAGIFSFAVLVVHSALRKITPPKPALQKQKHGKLEQRRK